MARRKSFWIFTEFFLWRYFGVKSYCLTIKTKTYTTKDFIHFQSDATTVVYCIADVIKIFIQDLVNVSLVIE